MSLYILPGGRAGYAAANLDMDAYNGDTGKATGWLSGQIAVDVTQTAPVQVVGVLVGDVSGDWNPMSTVGGTVLD
jgi:hypothetical protein